jgi:hypothetical protein
MITSLLPLLALPLAFAHPSPESSHNSHNPYRQALKREVTADATRVNGRAFDFVIAGGGCAGLALGARLSEWSNVTVLVIEAGTDGTEFEDRIDVPGMSPPYVQGHKLMMKVILILEVLEILLSIGDTLLHHRLTRWISSRSGLVEKG